MNELLEKVIKTNIDLRRGALFRKFIGDKTMVLPSVINMPSAAFLAPVDEKKMKRVDLEEGDYYASVLEASNGLAKHPLIIKKTLFKTDEPEIRHGVTHRKSLDECDYDIYGDMGLFSKSTTVLFDNNETVMFSERYKGFMPIVLRNGLCQYRFVDACKTRIDGKTSCSVTLINPETEIAKYAGTSGKISYMQGSHMVETENVFQQVENYFNIYFHDVRNNPYSEYSSEILNPNSNGETSVPEDGGMEQ